MVATIDEVRLAKTLGRHTRLAMRFRWQLNSQLVDLAAGGYTVSVFVEGVAGVVSGPRSASISGTDAIYVLEASDLQAASLNSDTPVKIVARAESTENTLISDARTIVVGDWGGADT